MFACLCCVQKRCEIKKIKINKKQKRLFYVTKASRGLFIFFNTMNHIYMNHAVAIL